MAQAFLGIWLIVDICLKAAGQRKLSTTIVPDLHAGFDVIDPREVRALPLGVAVKTKWPLLGRFFSISISLFFLCLG